MERLIDALTTLVVRGLPDGAPRARHGDTGKGPTSPRRMSVDLATAPDCVKRLAEAMSSRYYYIELGALSLYETGAHDEVITLESTMDSACERGAIDPQWVRDHAGPGGLAFDPAQTLELGADGGGMSMFGVTWSGGRLGLVLVEHDDPVQESFVEHFTTPDDFFTSLDERRDEDDDEAENLATLKAAAGA